jgi:hypothetical protein
VQWRPPASPRTTGWTWAVDAEISTQPVPEALAARTGITAPDAFWPRWTAVEVACKLLDVPVVMWISEHGLNPGDAADRGMVWRTVAYLDLTITAGGVRQPASPRAAR